ncbi:MAG: prolyl oligopeptidase family serine peptidase [Xanthomonadaceae bacterium]|nr:prolyl oligopeptidase family serine peptidase [Xanthomonadaceae bacterium]
MKNKGLLLFPVLLLVAHIDEVLAVQSPMIDKTDTCYQGEFSNLESYLSRPITRTAYDDPVQFERARVRYTWWRDNFDCDWISYSVDGLEVNGFVVKPTGDSPPEGWPVVIFNHGGNADIGSVRFEYIAARLFPIVEAGFVVMGTQYRGAKIDGADSPDRLRDEFGGSDVNDVLALISIADSIPEADGSRIGMYGISRGGMMSFLAARRTNRISTIVVQDTPTDLVRGLEFTPDMVRVFTKWIPDYEKNPHEALIQRSALYWLDELDPNMSVLILHGTADQRVSAEQALVTALKLQELRRQYKLVIYPNASHGLREYHQAVETEIIAWFSSVLRKDY